jgi:hypothetical protein
MQMTIPTTFLFVAMVGVVHTVSAAVHPRGQVLIRRGLQTVEEGCLEAGIALISENPDLAMAVQAYQNSLTTPVEARSSPEVDCTRVSDTSVICTVGEAKLDGQQEYEDACAAAGGVIVPFARDIECDVTLDGVKGTIQYDLADIVTCEPATLLNGTAVNCSSPIPETVLDGVNTAAFEQLLLSVGAGEGVTDVSCDAGTLTSAAPDHFTVSLVVPLLSSALFYILLSPSVLRRKEDRNYTRWTELTFVVSV